MRGFVMKFSILQIVGFLLLARLLYCEALAHHTFVLKEAQYTRLCSPKNILTVNGQFPGPTLYARKGETIIVDVINKGRINVTVHWHGVKQPRNPWSDGPEYITQCPIQPGGKFRQKIILSSEEGTVWWHAHSDWTRATVHGAIVVYPKIGHKYPFAEPYKEELIILGEWWKSDANAVLDEALNTGADPNVSDAFLINGQPGDLYPCSRRDTFKLNVTYGKTYLLRMVNAALQDILFFSIAKHKLTVVGTDASYTKPLTRSYIAISPGQTMDILLKTKNQPNYQNYYMAAKAYATATNVSYDNTTTTAILRYIGNNHHHHPPSFPHLPSFDDIHASVNFTGSLRSLNSIEHPIILPMNVIQKFIFTTSINLLPCPDESCAGPNGSRLASSMNNISFVSPSIDILKAYYMNISGVYESNFPNNPPVVFDFTAEYLPLVLEVPQTATKVKVLEYNSTLEIVMQNTNLVAGTDHPIHIHGHSFFVVGFGLGSFDPEKDPLKYNTVDPPLQSTIVVPKNGWAAIRFRAGNPGVWFVHCHLERHLSWGMEMAFIVKNGPTPDSQMLPPPTDMPPC